MGSNLFNRVKFTATSGTTADFAVSAAVTGYDTPATRGVTGGSSVSYTAESGDKSQWETGLGTYLSSSATISRVKIRESSNSGSAVAFTNPPSVWLDAHAQDFNGVSIFNVKAYGAKGDGSTDDTTAVNLAIAALNAAGQGTLYFPATANSYKITSTLTTITASCTICGDNAPNLIGTQGGVSAPAQNGSLISFTSGSTNLFVANGPQMLFRDMGMICTAASPSAGAAISVQSTSGIVYAVNLLNVATSSFFINWDYQTGDNWWIDNCMNVSYPGASANMSVKDVGHPDTGDWSISNTTFIGNATSGIKIVSQSEGRIVNCKVIGPPTGIDLTFSGSDQGFFISNCSIESCTTAISIVGSGSVFTGGLINNCEIGYSVHTAISLNNCTGVGINNIMLAGSNFTTPISLTSCTSISIVGLTLQSDFAMSGSLISNTPSVVSRTDVTGSVIGGGMAITAQTCISSANPSFNITSPGFTNLAVTGLSTSGTGSAINVICPGTADAAVTFFPGVISATGPVWTLLSQGSVAGAFILTHQGEGTVLTVGSTANGDATWAARRIVFAAANTSRASLNIPTSGATAPASPADGDMWYDGTNVKFRVGATTKTFTLT